MPVVPMQEILQDAFQHRYGVGAFNIFNDLTMEAVLAAAAETRSPVIVQVSLKTVRQMGPRLIQLMFQEMARRVPVPATLHLDHCPDRTVIEECMEAGWNSVLFDASNLSYEENLAQTRELVACRSPRRRGGGRRTRSHRGRGGRHRRRERRAGRGARQGPGLHSPDGRRQLRPGDRHRARRLQGRAQDQFRPRLGDRGRRTAAAGRARRHRLERRHFQDLIRRGAVKVNISTQLKITFADAFRAYLAERPAEYDPLKLPGAVKSDVQAMVAGFMRRVRQRREGGMSKVLIFDCDGVLGDTEQYGHLPAFNRCGASSACPGSGRSRSTGGN